MFRAEQKEIAKNLILLGITLDGSTRDRLRVQALINFMSSFVSHLANTDAVVIRHDLEKIEKAWLDEAIEEFLLG